jgi:hypothetical protein
VRRITLLKSRLGEAGSDALTFRQALSGAVNQLVVSLTMTSGQNTLPVVVLELEGEPDIDQRLMMQQGTINLPAACARIVANSVKSPELNRCGILVNWNDALDWVEWDVLIPEAGYYSIDLTTSAVHHSRVWTGGHVVRIETSGTAIQARITADVIDTRPETRYYAQATTHCGSLYFERSGEQQLACKALAIRPYDGLGLALVGLKLTRST